MAGSNPTLSNVLAALPTMGKTELAAVKAATEGLLRPLTSPIEQPATPLFDAMTRALGLKIGFAAFQATGTYKSYCRGETAFMAFIAENFPKATDSKVLHNAVISFMLDIIIEEIKRMEIPVTMKTVSEGLDRIAGLFDKAYPDYLSCGLGHMVLDAITKGRN